MPKKFKLKPRPKPSTVGRTVITVEIDAAGTRVHGEQQIHAADGSLVERMALEGELEETEEAALIAAAVVRARIGTDLALA